MVQLLLHVHGILKLCVHCWLISMQVRLSNLCVFVVLLILFDSLHFWFGWFEESVVRLMLWVHGSIKNMQVCSSFRVLLLECFNVVFNHLIYILTDGLYACDLLVSLIAWFSQSSVRMNKSEQSTWEVAFSLEVVKTGGVRISTMKPVNHYRHLVNDFNGTKPDVPSLIMSRNHADSATIWRYSALFAWTQSGTREYLRCRIRQQSMPRPAERLRRRRAFHLHTSVDSIHANALLRRVERTCTRSKGALRMHSSMVTLFELFIFESLTKEKLFLRRRETADAEKRSTEDFSGI